jgi:hypothetical protein
MTGWQGRLFALSIVPVADQRLRGIAPPSTKLVGANSPITYSQKSAIDLGRLGSNSISGLKERDFPDSPVVWIKGGA